MQTVLIKLGLINIYYTLFILNLVLIEYLINPLSRTALKDDNPTPLHSTPPHSTPPISYIVNSRFPFTAGHEKKRSNSLPTSPSNHSLSHGSMVSDSDYSDEMNATSESLYSSDSCFTNRDQRYECAVAAAAAAAAATANDLALSCTTRKQKFRDVMTSWKRSSLTPSTMSIASPPPHSHLEMKSWARVQEIRNVWEERLLNLAATEAKHRDERLTIWTPRTNKPIHTYIYI